MAVKKTQSGSKPAVKQNDKVESVKIVLAQADREKLLRYLNEEYTGAFFITFDILDMHKDMSAGTTKQFIKSLLKETGWEVEEETETTIKLRRIGA